MTTESELKRPDFSTELSQKELHEWLSYDTINGNFYWIKSPCNGIKINDIAGHIDESKKYVIISLRGRHYYGHVLAWFYVYGVWTKIDHKNRIGVNNWISNLRPATAQQNNRNQSIRIDNMLGVKGVTRSGNKYVARIHVDGHSLYLGTFNTIEEASCARSKAEIKHFGEFAATREA